MGIKNASVSLRKTSIILVQTYALNSVCFINHWTLFRTLLNRSIHIPIVRMPIYWYTKQDLCIKWGAEMSPYKTISNGVRQGGILSPSLFAVYMDDLYLLLNTSRIGGHIDDVCINHVFYADDLCLMAPCAIALQELIIIWCQYSKLMKLIWTLKGNAAYLKNIYIMDENDSLSEYTKIPLGHNRTNGAVYSKI